MDKLEINITSEAYQHFFADIVSLVQNHRVKAVQDALQLAGVFLDDEQVDFLWVVRRPIVQGGMCKVVLVEYDKVHQMLEQYEEYI